MTRTIAPRLIAPRLTILAALTVSMLGLAACGSDEPKTNVTVVTPPGSTVTTTH